MRTTLGGIDFEENKTVYVKKMNRQMREAGKQVRDLEEIAEERGAEENTEIRKEFETLKQKLNEVHQKFEGLKAETTEDWPEGSRDVSVAYKQLEDLIAQIGTKVKRK